MGGHLTKANGSRIFEWRLQFYGQEPLNGLIKTQKAVVFQLHEHRGGEQLGYGTNAKHGIGTNGNCRVNRGEANIFCPNNVLVVD